MAPDRTVRAICAERSSEATPYFAWNDRVRSCSAWVSMYLRSAA